jgi:pimeloyl-ACP methyl ester carboxylesterase
MTAMRMGAGGLRRLVVDLLPAVLTESVIIRTANVDFHAQRQTTDSRAVFLHGFGDDLHTWDAVWKVMGERIGGLRYDLRGFGHTVCRQTPFKHADDLRALLDATAIERCDLVGVSDGGSVALNFTLDHPERVRRLVLVSPGLIAWEWSEAWRKLWQPIVARARSGALAEARRLWWEHPLFSTTRASAAGPVLFESIMRFSGRQWIHDYQTPQLPDVERLHLLKTRTLLLTGGRDLEEFRLIADLIAASAANLQRSDDPARGHLLHLEASEGCAREIGSFLADESD